MEDKPELHVLYCRRRQRVVETYSVVSLRTGLKRSETRSRRVGKNSESIAASAPESSSLSRRKLWSFDGTSEANLAALSRPAILSLETGDIIPTIAEGKSGTLDFSELQLAASLNLLVKSNEFEASIAGKPMLMNSFNTTGIFLRRKFVPAAVTKCIQSRAGLS